MLHSYDELRNHFPYLAPTQPPPLLTVQSAGPAAYLQDNYQQVPTRVYGMVHETRHPAQQTYPAYVTSPPSPHTMHMRNAVSVRISETSAFEAISVARPSSSKFERRSSGPESHGQLSPQIPQCSCDTRPELNDEEQSYSSFKESSLQDYYRK